MPHHNNQTLARNKLMGWCVAVSAFAGSTVTGSGQTIRAEDNQRKEDLRILAKHGQSTNAPALLKFLHDRILSPNQQDHYREMIKSLGSGQYRTRYKNSLLLLRAGEKAKPFLRDAVVAKDGPLEVQRRAKWVLQQLGTYDELQLTCAVVREIGRHSPPQSAKLLLEYLPFVTDDEVRTALQSSLNQIVAKNVQEASAIAPSLLDMRDDKRMAAGEALAPLVKFRSKVRRLLVDENVQVRWRVAKTLVFAQDRNAVPALIDLLGQMPDEQTWRIEELLLRLATPIDKNIQFRDAKSPRQRAAAWAKWWKQNHQRVKMEHLTKAPPLKGLTLICQLGRGTLGQVYELDRNKKITWLVDNLRYPVDAAVIGPNRVLIAEYLNGVVTERDFQGKILWRHYIQMPNGCQRLPNGDTFISARQQLLIVSRAGKVVFSHTSANPIYAGLWLRSGHMIFIDALGQLHRLNANGKVLKSFHVGNVYTMGGSISALPGGRVLAPLYRQHKIVDVNMDGKVLRTLNVKYPMSAVRLPSGNTLIATRNPYRVIEMNVKGEIVWHHDTDVRTWQARRR